MDAVEALEQLGGIAGAADIVTLSSRRRLRTAVSNKAIVHVDRDRYALPVTDLGRRLAVEHNLHLTHLSAALHHGWEVRTSPSLPHLLLPSGQERPTSKARFWTYDARREELDGWATGPLLTVMLCARDLPFAAALTVADSALRHEAMAHEDLVAASDAWCGGNKDQVEKVAVHANGLAANAFESGLRAITAAAGVEFIPQYEVRVGALTVHPDLVDPINGIIIEADSWGFHADKEAHDRDCQRYTMLTSDGWIVLRFTYDQVMFQPEYVLRCIEMALAQRAAA
ncbi:endonuclease domain-containing protein [Nocardioides sp. NPDC051685]|uniref:endonuclease domain-containing protein n=1 Tax=Nocardioides sp. NPDC051685 TaxID=3364334 RepID=UPI0037AF5DBF